MTTLSCYHAVKRIAEDTSRPAPAASYINAVFVGDRSGSMSTMGSVPQEGAADFLQKHKELAEKNPLSEICVTVVTFDNRSQVAYSGHAKNITQEDIEKVKRHMIPRNTTRLIDTAIEEIEKQAKALFLAKRRLQDPRARSRVSLEVRRLEPSVASSFTLLTDGEDNESRHWCSDLNATIKEHQAVHGTVCLFAAANQDAVKMGAMYGFKDDRALQIGNDVDEARAAFRSCTNAAVRSATQQSSDFLAVEREASCTIDFYDQSGGAQPFDGYDGDDYESDHDSGQRGYCPVPRATRC